LRYISSAFWNVFSASGRSASLMFFARTSHSFSITPTHHFALGDTMAAYDTFSAAAESNALKVVLGVCALFNIVFFIYPAPLVGVASAAAQSLF